jgi:predicted CXXCH cytochrome family protein
MKWHVLYPLWVAIGVVGLIIVGGRILVPEDFGVHGRNFTYGYHRLSSLQDWKDVSVKHQGRDYCAGCHQDNIQSLQGSVHAPVQCENCHGPGANHPGVVPKLTIDTSRELCLRCHASLGYPNSNRGAMPSIVDRRHMRRRECSKCHDPHNPREISE